MLTTAVSNRAAAFFSTYRCVVLASDALYLNLRWHRVSKLRFAPVYPILVRFLTQPHPEKMGKRTYSGTFR